MLQIGDFNKDLSLLATCQRRIFEALAPSSLVAVPQAHDNVEGCAWCMFTFHLQVLNHEAKSTFTSCMQACGSPELE